MSTALPPPARRRPAAPLRSGYDLDREELATLLSDEPRYRVDQVWDGWYRLGRLTEELTTLPVRLRERLAAAAPPALSQADERISDGDRTVKWLWRLSDDRLIETVVMRYPQRCTVCVSTQAGCAMGCSFCATGQVGFERHLTTGEIVEQVVRARRRAAEDGSRLSNVVFMGMGEPLANLDAVWPAVQRLHGDLGLSARHLTLSTVGIVPGIERLSECELPVNLAVSLHAATDELRDTIVPVNRRYPLAVLAEALDAYVERTRRRVSFEWAMIDQVNDTADQARALADYARRRRAHINLIPLNPTPGYAVRGTPPARIAAFVAELERHGANVTVRHNRGTSIDAACGQLRASVGAHPPPFSGEHRGL